MSVFSRLAVWVSRQPSTTPLAPRTEADPAKELCAFLSGLSDEELIRWDALLESGLSEEGAQKALQPHLEFHGEKWAWDTIDFDPKDRAFSDISPIAKLTNLRRICINGCLVSDLTPLSNLSQLERLQLARMARLTDIAPLTGLTNLKMLDLIATRVEDIAPLAYLKNLEEFYLFGPEVKDLTPIANLTKLTDLCLPSLRDLGVLEKLTRLRSLRVSGRRLRDLRPLSTLTNLEELWIEHTRVRDVACLRELHNLRDLRLYNSGATEKQAADLQKYLPDTDVVFRR